MGDASSASGRRCPKHPSEPPFTGFCSACLLDRFQATNLAPPQPPPPSLLVEAALEEPPPCSTAATATGGAGRTTLIHLFQLEDQGANHQRGGGQEDTSSASAAAPSTSGAQDPPPELQRKRSLRQSCSNWIACCDTSAAASYSSCLPSRQFLDADAAAAADPHPKNAAAADAPPSTTSTAGVAVVERRTGSLRWNQVRGFLAKPAGHLLNRSFSESSRSRFAHQPGNAAIARSSSSQSQGMRLNGSHSVSSAGNGMDSSEISLPDDSAHVHHCRPRLKNRLHWLRRSRSIHYSPPTSLVDAGFTPFRSRSSSTRSTADKTQQARRLNFNLFAAGFFGNQRHHQH
uniref:Uncharacterized protein n=1 Tax=Arundo donax TaxID=35708 RepID=A0A0A8Y2M1_ARUDO